MGTGEVHDLARGEVKREDAARFLVDLRPCLGRYRSAIPIEEIHHFIPLKLPMTRDAVPGVS